MTLVMGRVIRTNEPIKIYDKQMLLQKLEWCCGNGGQNYDFNAGTHVKILPLQLVDLKNWLGQLKLFSNPSQPCD
jgi:hypothetical protein